DGGAHPCADLVTEDLSTNLSLGSWNFPRTINIIPGRAGTINVKVTAGVGNVPVLVTTTEPLPPTPDFKSPQAPLGDAKPMEVFGTKDFPIELAFASDNGVGVVGCQTAQDDCNKIELDGGLPIQRSYMRCAANTAPRIFNDTNSSCSPADAQFVSLA